MSITHSRLSVLFEAPFWIALDERETDGKYEVCKVTFGAEPKDYGVHAFFLKNWRRLVFSPSIEASALTERRINPKRLQREIRRQMTDAGIGTKAQQALKLQQEQNKTERKTRSREQKQAEKDRQFALRQEKRLQKRRGH